MLWRVLQRWVGLLLRFGGAAEVRGCFGGVKTAEEGWRMLQRVLRGSRSCCEGCFRGVGGAAEDAIEVCTSALGIH